jgi:hypothetical protein
VATVRRQTVCSHSGFCLMRWGECACVAELATLLRMCHFPPVWQASTSLGLFSVPGSKFAVDPPPPPPRWTLSVPSLRFLGIGDLCCHAALLSSVHTVWRGGGRAPDLLACRHLAPYPLLARSSVLHCSLRDALTGAPVYGRPCSTRARSSEDEHRQYLPCV